MVCEHLDFYLLSYLVLHACLFYLLLVYHLYAQDETCPQVTGHVNITKSALSQLTTDLELRQ